MRNATAGMQETFRLYTYMYCFSLRCHRDWGVDVREHPPDLYRVWHLADARRLHRHPDRGPFPLHVPRLRPAVLRKGRWTASLAEGGSIPRVRLQTVY